MAAHNYKYTLEFVLSKEIEGGYVNDPRDKGGETNLGITKNSYEAYLGRAVRPGEMKELTIVEAAPFYRKLYWNKLECDSLPVGIDLCIFDFGVNSGISRSAKFFQELIGAKPDGAIGPKTLNKFEEYITKQITAEEDIIAVLRKFVTLFCNKRRTFLKSLADFEHFGKGWLKRVKLIEERATQMLEKKVKNLSEETRPKMSDV